MLLFAIIWHTEDNNHLFKGLFMMGTAQVWLHTCIFVIKRDEASCEEYNALKALGQEPMSEMLSLRFASPPQLLSSAENASFFLQN